MLKLKIIKFKGVNLTLGVSKTKEELAKANKAEVSDSVNSLKCQNTNQKETISSEKLHFPRISSVS